MNEFFKPSNESESGGEPDVLQLEAHQIVSEEQKEALEQIAEINQKIDKLQIIINSITHRTDDGEKWERPTLQYTHEKNVKEGEDALLNAYLNGQEAGDVEERLLRDKAEAKQSAAFYGEQRDQMLARRQSSDGSYFEGDAKILNQDPEAFSEDIEALLSKLEELGLPRDEFIAGMKEARPLRDDETHRAEIVLKKFKSTLALERNTARLTLPNEAVKMTVEAIKETNRDKLDYQSILKSITRGSTDGSFKVGALYEAITPKPWELDEYPEEVQKRFFEFVSKKTLEASERSPGVGTEDSVAEALAEIYSLRKEVSRHSEDLDFDVQTQEAIIGLLENEESYLIECLKHDQKLSLRSSPGSVDWGIRFDPKDTDASQVIEWPVLPHAVVSEEDNIRHRGNVRLNEYDKYNGLRTAMANTHAALKESFPHNKTVDALEVIIALRKTKETVKDRLVDLEIEREHVHLKEGLLKALQEKTVSI